MNVPVLFVSHGAPTIAIDPGVTVQAWQKLGRELPRPSSILVVSAHWETDEPVVSTAAHPETIHDFYGFSEEMYRLRYPAPGAPELAQRVAALLRQQGIPAATDEQRGLDHGAWVPLMQMYPQADIPVTQLSLQPKKNPAWHIALGRVLRPLREEGVLIIGSGSISHNLRALSSHPQGEPVPEWVTKFCGWMAQRIKEGDIAALSDYRAQAPHAAQNHPTDEHLLPLFVSLGASDGIFNAQHLNQVKTHGLLTMDIWLFDA